MDILAHALWTGFGTKKINQALKKENKERVNPSWTIFWGIFPDLFAFVIPGVWMVFLFFKEVPIEGRIESSAYGLPFDFAYALYPFSHSLVLFTGVFFATWFIYKSPRWVLLGWGFHIFLDTFSHTLGKYSTPFLFPISDYKFPYGISWYNDWFMLVNYILLLSIALFFIFRKKHQS